MQDTQQTEACDTANSTPAHFNQSGQVTEERQNANQPPDSYEGEPCPICLNNMEDTNHALNEDGLAVLESCKHIYHISCIKAWSDVTNTCPLCKARFTKLNIFDTLDSCTKYLSANRIMDETMHLIREESVTNRDQHDQHEHFINLNEIYYEEDGVQCTDMCYLRNGAPFMDGFHFSVQCDTCQNWFHGCCVGFVSELDPPLIWHCNSCHVNNNNSNNNTENLAISNTTATTNNNENNNVNNNLINDNNNLNNNFDNNAFNVNDENNILDKSDPTATIVPTNTNGAIQEIDGINLANNGVNVENGSGALDVAPPPPATTVVTYRCDHHCGFIGTYKAVEEHEKTCVKKSRRAKPKEKTQAPIVDFLKFSPDLCTICYDDANAVDNIIFCDRCNISVHQSCYNIPKIPPDSWYCDTCSAGFDEPPKCIFCPNKGNIGAMRRTHDGRWAHSFCALWIPEAGFLHTKNMEPICSIDKSNHRKGSLDRIPNGLFNECCGVCGQTDGAVMFCSSPRCKFAFHPSCGKKEGFYMFIERTNDKKSEIFLMTSFCKQHTRINRTSKFTGKDVEIWLPFDNKWSKARVGYYRPKDNTHLVAYHEDGVIEEIYDLENLINITKKKNIIEGKKSTKKRSRQELEVVNSNLVKIRLLDTFTPPAVTSAPAIGKQLPAYIFKRHNYNFPDHSWQCNFCKAYNHEKRIICNRCCVDSRRWKSFFTQEKVHTFKPYKRRRKYWPEDHFFQASWV